MAVVVRVEAAEASTAAVPAGSVADVDTVAQAVRSVVGRIAPVAIPVPARLADQRIVAARAATAAAVHTEAQLIAAVYMAGRTAEGVPLTRVRAAFRVALLVRRRREAPLRMDSGILLAALAVAGQRHLGRAALQMAALRGQAQEFAMRARQSRTANGTPSAATATNPLGDLRHRISWRVRRWCQTVPRVFRHLDSALLVQAAPRSTTPDSGRARH